jgi:hypothetical protein
MITASLSWWLINPFNWLQLTTTGINKAAVDVSMYAFFKHYKQINKSYALAIYFIHKHGTEVWLKNTIFARKQRLNR